MRVLAPSDLPDNLHLPIRGIGEFAQKFVQLPGLIFVRRLRNVSAKTLAESLERSVRDSGNPDIGFARIRILDPIYDVVSVRPLFTLSHHIQ